MKDVNTDRDSTIERLLRETLRSRAASGSTGGCLDPETVAAWSDRTLDADDRAAAEAHAADCGRCQALLAAIAASTPAELVKPWWRAHMAGWLLPLSAATAALIVWTIVPGRTSSSQSRDRAARTVDTPAMAPVATPPKAKDEIASAAKSPDRAAVLPAPRTQAVPAPGGSRVKLDSNSRLEANQEHLKKQPTPTNEIAPAPAEARTGSLAAAPAAGSAGGAVAGAATAPLSINSAVAAPQTSDQKAAARIVSGVMRDDAASAVIVSPMPNSRWRIVPGRPIASVERSFDGGLTWQTQELGGSVTLAAGGSPSPLVCWLVGPRGLVLLSTDGRVWHRVGFPEGINLVSVQPTDEKGATVTASDGRAFSTTDGGLSWAPVPRQ